MTTVTIGWQAPGWLSATPARIRSQSVAQVLLSQPQTTGPLSTWHSCGVAFFTHSPTAVSQDLKSQTSSGGQAGRYIRLPHCLVQSPL